MSKTFLDADEGRFNWQRALLSFNNMSKHDSFIKELKVLTTTMTTMTR